MSYTYLQEQGEVFSAESFADIPPCALSKLNLTAAKCFSPGNGTESCHASQSGMTCEPSTADRGADSLTSFAEDSRAKESAKPTKTPQDWMTQEADYGQSKNESLAKLDPVSLLWKTAQGSLFEDLEPSLETWPQWGMMRGGECFHVKMPVAFTYESASGLRLPTPRNCTAMQARITEATALAKFPNLETVLPRLTLPTIVKSEGRGTSAKRFIGSPDFRGAKMSEGLRTCETDPIYLNPSFAELVMMWPMGWTDLHPLATDKFREWQQQHGEF